MCTQCISPLSSLSLTPDPFRPFLPAPKHPSSIRLFLDPPPHILRRSKRPQSPSRKRGLSFERRVHSLLDSLYPLNHLPSPWLRYTHRGKTYWCSPDSLLIFPEKRRIVLIEIKLRHCDMAWLQLRDLYYPLLQSLFAPYHFQLVEVVRWHDADPRFPVLSHFAPHFQHGVMLFLDLERLSDGL